MAVLSLPLSFSNSFWTQDYRKGLEVLYQKLEQGVAENDQVIAFIKARAAAEASLAAALAIPLAAGPEGSAFKEDDGATLLMAFRGLQTETVKQGEAHDAISKELTSLVVEPFSKWAKGYKERIHQSRAAMLDGYTRSYEHSSSDVAKLRAAYLAKVRKADEAEDDAKFAPNSQVSDKYTTSPRLAPSDAPKTSSISERIAGRLKEIQRKTANATASPSSAPEDKPAPAIPEEQPFMSPKVDKGKGKAVDGPEPSATMSPPPLSPPLPPLSPPLPPTKLTIPESPVAPRPEPFLLAGLSFTPAALSSMLTRAAAELPLRPVRFPLLGEYPDCFTGEEILAWLVQNVQGFDGSFDRAEDAARELTERDKLLRRIGEFGNSFEASDDAFYQFRPRAFDLAKPPAAAPPNAAGNTLLSPVADNLVKRSNNFFSVVSKALNATNAGEPPHIRARADADAADREYRVAVRKLDRQRLGLEERIEEALKTLQKWEADRLQAVKTVLLQYHGTLSNLPRALEPSLERSATFISAFMPESDLTALIERYRTGPFRPRPQLYESVAHDESDVLFGIDLRKWAEGGWSALHGGEEKRETVPPVLTALLEGLERAYAKLESDAEKRRTWIYEVPLPAVHHLREALNAVPAEQPLPVEITQKYDAPVLASTVKLWALELDPPLALWEGWDEIRRLYPYVGNDEAKEKEHLEALQAALLRFPKVHLYVLDAIVGHLRHLMDTTRVEETDEVYITKLALSIGRTVVRPKVETEMTIQDRHPAMFFIDLLKYYAQILPPTIAKKKRDSERKVPIRKRTAPIDMRMSRSRLSQGTEARDWLIAQRAAGQVPPPVPPLPTGASTAAAPPPVAPAEPAPVPESVAEPVPESPTSLEIPAAPAAELPSSPVEEFHDPEPVEEVPAPVPVPAPAPSPPAADPDVPPRPSFKTPPPEDDEPPRPAAFKEPDLDDLSPPPTRPTFPDGRSDDSRSQSPVIVSPPTPSRKGSISSPSRPASPHVRVRSPLRSGTPTSPSALASRFETSRSPSPAVAANDDQPLSAGRASISRNTSNEGRLRGPRGTRGPRPSGGGSVSNIISNINRNSVAGPPGSPGRPTSPPGGAAKGRRPVSGLVDEKRRSFQNPGPLSRRTMDSDAEDNLVG